VHGPQPLTETSSGREFERELLYSEAIEQLRALTAGVEVTQRELGRRLGVSDARISRIMTGRENLTLRTLSDLGWSLGVRCELVLLPLQGDERRATPAKADPPPPRWLHKHAQALAQSVRESDS
jgi:transcriptional regulator with XRE-family HTH domain